MTFSYSLNAVVQRQPLQSEAATRLSGGGPSGPERTGTIGYVVRGARSEHDDCHTHQRNTRANQVPCRWPYFVDGPQPKYRHKNINTTIRSVDSASGGFDIPLAGFVRCNYPLLVTFFVFVRLKRWRIPGSFLIIPLTLIWLPS